MTADPYDLRDEEPTLDGLPLPDPDLAADADLSADLDPEPPDGPGDPDEPAAPELFPADDLSPDDLAFDRTGVEDGTALVGIEPDLPTADTEDAAGWPDLPTLDLDEPLTPADGGPWTDPLDLGEEPAEDGDLDEDADLDEETRAWFPVTETPADALVDLRAALGEDALDPVGSAADQWAALRAVDDPAVRALAGLWAPADPRAV
jgi:hypothetical protein